jgi:8-oxo-dGTP diphosphatase
MNRFNEGEFREICRKFNSEAYAKDVVIKYEKSSYFNRIKNSVQHDRRGEVVFCVIRPNGRIITTTCSEYPDGVFRIPTGGVGYKENIIDAVYREIKEELGLEVEIISFAGVLKIKFMHNNDSVMFYSYIFIVREKGGNLLKDASDNEISEVREVNLEDLKDIVYLLDNIEGRWSDWGKFRYKTSKAVLDYLKKSGFS